MRWYSSLVILIFLCQCATKHSPKEFSPFFLKEPNAYFSPKQVGETLALEARTDLTVHEKRKLWSLYQLEQKGLKPSTARYQEVEKRIQVLYPDVEALDRRVKDVQSENASKKEVLPNEEKPMVFESAEVRKEYQSVYQLWNKDLNEEALVRLREILAGPLYSEKANRAEKFKLRHLEFRIAFDLGDGKTTEESLNALTDVDKCHPDTTQASFLLALRKFSAGDAAGAYELFTKSCDEDTSAPNQVRHWYWEARFLENIPERRDEMLSRYQKVLATGVPNYYFFLSHVRLNRALDFSRDSFYNRSYLKQELEVSSEIAELWDSAETALTNNLRRDAGVFLTRASQILRSKKEVDVSAALYTAHLLQASGSPLEAMKLYAAVNSRYQGWEAEGEDPEVPFDFLAEMFPTPHGTTVDWLARQWNVDPDFIYSIMRQESAFNPTAVSPADARGLMQLMPFLARSIAGLWAYGDFSERFLFHAQENLKIAVYHLHQLQTAAPHIALMAASYNAGLSRVLKWWKRNPALPLDIFVEFIPINETRNYVKLVIRNYVHYRAIRYGGKVNPDSVPFTLPTLNPKWLAFNRDTDLNTNRRQSSFPEVTKIGFGYRIHKQPLLLTP